MIGHLSRSKQLFQSKFSQAVMGLMFLTIFTGLVNFSSNILAARLLGPVKYSDYGTFMALLSMLLLPTSGITNRAAQLSALAFSGTKLAQLRRTSLMVGIGLACAGIVVIGGVYRHLYHVPIPLWIAILTGILLSFVPLEAYYVGILQGQKKFVISQWGRALNACFKTLGMAGLFFYARNLQAALVIVLLSLTVSFSYIMLRNYRSKQTKESVNTNVPKEGSSWLAYATIVSSVLFYNVDMLVAKSVFSSYDAGLFAALTFSGKILSLATVPINYVLYPYLLTSSSQRQRKLSLAAFGTVLAVCLILLASLGLAGDTLTKILFGRSYLPIGPDLVFYGLALTFFSLTNVAFTILLAKNSHWLWIDVIGGGTLELGMLLTFHTSLPTFVFALSASMAILWVVSSLQSMHLLHSHNGTRDISLKGDKIT